MVVTRSQASTTSPSPSSSKEKNVATVDFEDDSTINAAAWSKVVGVEDKHKSYTLTSPPSWIPFMAVTPVFPLLVYVGQYLAVKTGYDSFSYLSIAFAFVLLPWLDMTLGYESGNFPPEKRTSVNPRPYLLVLEVVAVVCVVLVVGGASYAATGISWARFFGLALSTGMVTGALGITFAHELIHMDGFYKILGSFMLCCNCYGHFTVEHVEGHHKNVATRKDPATSRLGEGFWMYYPRTVIGGYLSAWHLESEYQSRKGRSLFTIYNRMVHYHIISFAIAGYLYWTIGSTGVFFFIVQSWFGVLLLELVNYIEHYGLIREKVGPNTYEPVEIRHSWESRERLASWFLIRLQRHSDHHYRGKRPYYLLQTHDDAPQLPMTYPWMLIIALFPFIWHRVMDWRVEAYREEVRRRYQHKLKDE